MSNGPCGSGQFEIIRDNKGKFVCGEDYEVVGHVLQQS
jgi:hypothetical protein